MDNNIITSTDAIGLFCRLHMKAKKDIPIRPSEMGVLIFTQKHNVPLTPSMISNFFKITKPSVTSIVNTLIKDKYLMKSPSTTDKRSYTVSITDKGENLVESTFDEYYGITALLKRKMGSKEFSLFIELIQRANSILSEEK